MRLFLALPLPSTVVALASDVQTCLRNVNQGQAALFRDVQFSRTTAHITLAFLGETDETIPRLLYDKVRQHVNQLAITTSPHLVAHRDVQTFNSAANVVYMPVTIDDAMRNAQSAVYAAAASCCPSLDRKSFKPHVTIARAQTPRNHRAVTKRSNALEDARGKLHDRNLEDPGGAQLAFTAENVVLYESKKMEGCVVYEKLWSVALVKGGVVSS